MAASSGTRTWVVPQSEESGNSEKATVMYPGHSLHPLAECYLYPGGMGCKECGQPVPPGYAYGCEACEYYLHISCLPPVHADLLHPQHPLTLRYAIGEGMYPCQICESSVYLTFHCDPCNFHLCVYCMSVSPKWRFEHGGHLFVSIEIGLHEDSAIARFVDGYACHVCGNSRDTKFFKCMSPGCFTFCHFHCIPFDVPQTIKHEYHYDTITFSEPFAEDYFTAHYCDACEEARDPEAMIYRCAECNFNAHTACAISQVLPALVAEREANPSTRPFCVDPVREKLNHKIDQLRAEENWRMSKLQKIEVKLEKTERTCANYAAFMERKTVEGNEL